jgi:hypothetical protein
MQAKQLKNFVLAFGFSLAASSAMAADYQVGGEAYASFPIPNSFSKTAASSKTRAEVKAELAQARSQGQQSGGEEYASFPATGKNEAALARARSDAEAVKAAESKPANQANGG